MTGPAVFVVLLVIIIGRACWKKPNAGARLAALLGLAIGLFFIFAVVSPDGAGTFASDSATGVAQLFSGIGHIISTFRHS